MEKIDYGNYYHIYNRGTDGMVIFRKDDDYLHFLSLISIYLEPIAEIFAYALMGNHFHFLISIGIIVLSARKNLNHKLYILLVYRKVYKGYLILIIL